jgi:hypothetical protein
MKVDIEDELHPVLKEHCAAKGTTVTAFVSGLIRDALELSGVGPVAKVEIEPAEPRSTGEDPYLRPPFWAGRRSTDA